MTKRRVSNGIAVRDLRQHWKAVRGLAEIVRGTGEERWRDPDTRAAVKFNRRRKIAPRKLVSLVNHRLDAVDR